MKKSAVLIICLWMFIICVFIFAQEIIIHTGREVLLETVPVDPRDLLLGDYVILNYKIAQIPKEYKFGYNEQVYARLDIDSNNVAHLSEITYNKPTGVTFLKGKTGRCNTTIPLFKTGKCINFGIESYYVKEGAGKELENDLQNGAFVRVVIDKNGRSKVRGFTK